MLMPLMLEMAGQPVVCVGAGPVAAAKIVPLLECGAVVTVIAPQVDPRLVIAQTVLQRPYVAEDLDGTPRPRLVVAATGVDAIDGRVAEDAASRGIWCLRISGDTEVTVPSVIRRAGMVLAMTTGAPALTKRLRQTLEETLDDRWGVASKTLSALRQDPAVRATLAAATAAQRRQRWHQAVDMMLAEGPRPEADAALAILTGTAPAADYPSKRARPRKL